MKNWFRKNPTIGWLFVICGVIALAEIGLIYERWAEGRAQMAKAQQRLQEYEAMRDVVIPGALQDAMSREAQAAREKQARIILGEAELAIAHSFAEAAKSYEHNPTALHLRAMNMLYEGLKEKGALMLIPSSAVESMGMGGLMGAAAMRQASLTGGEAIGDKRRISE